MNQYLKVREQDEWVQEAVRTIIGRSLDRRVYVVSADDLFKGGDDDFSLDGAPRLSCDVQLINRTDFCKVVDSPIFIATQIERGQNGPVPVTRILAKKTEGNIPCRFSIVMGRFGTFPATMGIRTDDVKAILECADSDKDLKALMQKLTDASGKYATLHSLRDWKSFYHSRARKNGEYWNWRGVTVHGDGLDTIAQIGNILSTWEITDAHGNVYPYIAPVREGTASTETSAPAPQGQLPFGDVVKAAQQAEQTTVAEAVG